MTERIVEPKSHIQSSAHVRSWEEYQTLYADSLADPSGFWERQSRRIDFFAPFSSVTRQDFGNAEFAWFVDGKLNVAHNCIDRHLADKAEQTAIVWAGDEPGTYRHISYRELHDNVCRLANALKHHGVRKGDRVCLYLPMIPEIAYAMLACARIGAVHSVVFAGFSAESLRDRIVDADCRVVLTANEGMRGGKAIPLKKITDDAIEGLPVHTVLVAKRTETAVEILGPGAGTMSRPRWKRGTRGSLRTLRRWTCRARWTRALTS